MTALLEIQGIGPSKATKLKAAGIRSVEALLLQGATPKGRKEIVAAGFSKGEILRWVNHADLFRVKGVAGQYAELLEASGVDTIVELSKRDPENLAETMAKKNTSGPRRIVRLVPSAKSVKAWVAQAKKLKRVVTY
jgi:predicted flap endonuclease-1-like 5' DNA nuclease